MVCNSNVNTFFKGVIVINVPFLFWIGVTWIMPYVIDSYVVDLLSIGVSGLLLFIFLVLAFTFGEG